MVVAAFAGIFLVALAIILLAIFLKPKCKKKSTTENLQLYDGYQEAPEGVKTVAGPLPQQMESQRKRNIQFADQVYVKEYGGPFGDGRERMVPMGQKIKSSDGYGFRPPPPDVSVSSNQYDHYPAVPTSNGITYRQVQGETCSAEHISNSMSMILDTCDALCSHDNQCLAFSYDFSNGNCMTYANCDSTIPATRNSKLFVKSKIERQMT